MPFLTQENTNWKFIGIVVVLAVIVVAGILGYRWWVIQEEVKISEVKIPEEVIPEGKMPADIKPVPDELLWNTETIIRSLLDAERVIIRSEARGDVDNDKQEDLVVIATVVEGTRPAYAGGERPYKSTTDLMIISRKEGRYIFKAYFMNVFGVATAPKIYLKDFAGDEKLEIILSSLALELKSWVSTAMIYKLEGDQLNPVRFKGGELDGLLSIRGALVPDELKPNQLSVFYGREGGVSDFYIWNEDGFFEFLSTTSREPTELHKLVINYLELNITDIVTPKPWGPKFIISAIQFYPENRVLTEFEDGHMVGYFLGQYELKNNEVYIEYIDEAIGLERLIEFRTKYGLTADEAVNYFLSRQNFKWTPVDLLPHGI